MNTKTLTNIAALMVCLSITQTATAQDTRAATGPAATRPAATRPAVPGLIRGIMTNDVKVLQEVGSNSCMLWGPPAKQEAWDKLIDAGLFPFLGSLGEPKKEFFTFDGRKHVKMNIPFCYGGEWGRWWVQHVADAAGKHYPAVCSVTTDELSWNNPGMAYSFSMPLPPGIKFYCDCDWCLKAGGSPEITASRFLADTPASRRLIEQRYRALAGRLKDAIEAAKKVDPAFMSYGVLNLRDVYALERYPYGVVLDTLPQMDFLLATAFQTSVDRRGDETRFMQPLTVKYLLAARPRLGAIPALAATVYDYKEKFWWTESYCWRKDVEDVLPQAMVDALNKDMAPYKQSDDDVILPAISCLGSGAKGVLFFGDDRRAALKKLFSLMDKLEKPLAGAAVPADVVVLCSRQSEDEWMLTHAPKDGPRKDLSDALTLLGCWAQPADRLAWEYARNAEYAKGLRASQVTMEALVRMGIPFRMYFMEDLKADDLAGAKAVIVPFCTHISDAAVTLLQQTASKHAAVIFAHRGEFDAVGKQRAKPALAGLPGTFVIREATESLKDPAGRARLREALGNISCLATCDSELLELSWLNLPGGGTAVFLINWDTKPLNAQLALPADGKATMLDLDGTATDVQPRDTVQVPAREARIVIQSGQGR